MKCDYILKIGSEIVRLKDDKALVEHLRKNPFPSLQGEVFIKESRHGNTLQNNTLNNLSKSSNYDENDDTPYKFLSSPHKVGNVETTLVLPFNSAEYIEILKSDIKKELGNPTKEVIDNKIATILKTNTLMQDITLDLNKIFQDKIQYPSNDNTELLKQLILKVVEFNNNLTGNKEVLTDDIIKKYSDKIIKTIDLKVQELEDLGGVLQPRQGLSVRDSLINDNFTMSAQAHIVNVDPEGTSHLFELRTSEIPFDLWDKEKKKHTDYVLGIKRQLMSNYVDTSQTSLNIINIVIPKESNGTLSIGNVYITPTIERTHLTKKNSTQFEATIDPLDHIQGPMTTLLRNLLPANLPSQNISPTDLIDETTRLLNVAFPGYKIKTKAIAEAESIIKKALEKSKDENEIYYIDKLRTHYTKVIISKSEPN